MGRPPILIPGVSRSILTSLLNWETNVLPVEDHMQHLPAHRGPQFSFQH
jgi:hypothetical protein